jgi:transcriptional regulator with XRE-family HTH domain
MSGKEIEATIILRHNVIKSKRLKLRLSQKKFADLLGISYHYVSRAECLDIKNVSYEARKKIAKFLGKTVDEVFPPWMEYIKKSKVIKELDLSEIPLLQNQMTQVVASLPPRSPEDTLIRKEKCERIEEILTELRGTHPKHIHSFEEHILGGRTLEDIGNECGVGKERIRQRVFKVIRLIRHSKRSRKLYPPEDVYDD